MTKKKTRRPNLPQETLERARAEMRGEISPVAVESASIEKSTAAPRPKAVRAVSTGSATRRVPTIEELKESYTYVLHDLRNLAIVAVILFAIIIAAALFLPSIGV